MMTSKMLAAALSVTVASESSEESLPADDIEDDCSMSALKLESSVAKNVSIASR